MNLCLDQLSGVQHWCFKGLATMPCSCMSGCKPRMACGRLRGHYLISTVISFRVYSVLILLCLRTAFHMSHHIPSHHIASHHIPSIHHITFHLSHPIPSHHNVMTSHTSHHITSITSHSIPLIASITSHHRLCAMKGV